MRISIQRKILASQLWHTLLATLVLGIAAYAIMMYHLEEAQSHHLDDTAQYTSERLSTSMSHWESELKTIAMGEPVSRYRQKYQDQMLIQYFHRFSSVYPELCYLNPSGQEELKLVQGLSSDALFDQADHPLVQQVLVQTNQVISRIPTPKPGQPSQTIDFAFCRKNFFDEIEYIVTAKVPLNRLSQELQDHPCDRKGYYIVLDRQGRILAHPSSDKIGQDSGLLLADGTGRQQVRLQDQDCILAYHYSGERPWITVAVLPVAEYMAAPRSLQKAILIIVTFLLVISTILSKILSSNLARPVEALAQAAQQVAAGDLTVKLAVTSHDELGDLCESFNQMTEDLQRTTTSIDVLNQEIEQRQVAQAGQERLMDQLKASNQELQDFAHIVSHDLKAPLRGIRSLATWLADDYRDQLDDMGKEQLALLQTRVDRMKNLIDGVLKYSRAGRNHIEFQDMDLNPIIRDILDSLSIPEHIVVTCPENLPTVPYDPVCITQVFQNLLSNAIKYMDKEEGKIELSVTQDETQWTFSVADNGPGIGPQYHQKVFGIFQTLQARDTYESTGIGLALVKKIVERSGGRIWLASEEGQGSTFSFTVLRNPPRLEQAEETPIQQPQPLEPDKPEFII